MKCGRSKKGYPTVTENGGGSVKIGACQLVCGANGEKVKPLFVPTGYSNEDHAIFVAKIGMCLVNFIHTEENEICRVERIIGIALNQPTRPALSNELTLDLVGSSRDGDSDIPKEFDEVFSAAEKKAYDYHCRIPMYVLEEDPPTK